MTTVSTELPVAGARQTSHLLGKILCLISLAPLHVTICDANNSPSVEQTLQEGNINMSKQEKAKQKNAILASDVQNQASSEQMKN